MKNSYFNCKSLLGEQQPWQTQKHQRTSEFFASSLELQTPNNDDKAHHCQYERNIEIDFVWINFKGLSVVGL